MQKQPPHPVIRPAEAIMPRAAQLPEKTAAEGQVLMPDTVAIPLPKEPAEQIAIPASINGRDLSRGQP